MRLASTDPRKHGFTGRQWDLLCYGTPCVVWLQDLDVWVLLLDTGLEILAAPEPSNEEDALLPSVLLPACVGELSCNTHRDAPSRSLDLDRLDLVVDKPEDIRDQRGEDGFQVLPMR